MEVPAISVLITIFNGERYLAQTLDSLLAQRFQDFEVLCGNDCSTDGSLAILESYAKKDARIRPFTTPANTGTSPRVMNFLLPNVRGRWLAYSSQDDLYSKDWLEQMHARAVATGADAVLPDLVFMRGDKRRNTMIVGVFGDREVELSNTEAVRLSLEGSIHAFALWKSALIKEVRYSEFSMNADEYSSRVFLDRCRKVVFSPGTFFYRQDNPEAITKKLSVGTFDLPLTHLMQYRFLRDRGYPDEVAASELLRAVSSLFWMKRRLASGRRLLTPEQRLEADRRLRKTFDLLNDLEFRPVVQRLREQGRRVDRAKLTLLRAGYAAFSLACDATAGFGLFRGVLP